MKYCKNCKHFKLTDHDYKDLKDKLRFSKCSLSIENPGEILIDPELVRYSYASVMRQSLVATHCGPEGKFFEEKEKYELAKKNQICFL